MGYINAGLDGIIISLALFFSLFLTIMIPMEIIGYIRLKLKRRKIRRYYENKQD